MIIFTFAKDFMYWPVLPLLFVSRITPSYEQIWVKMSGNIADYILVMFQIW